MSAGSPSIIAQSHVLLKERVFVVIYGGFGSSFRRLRIASHFGRNYISDSYNIMDCSIYYINITGVYSGRHVITRRDRVDMA